MGARSAMFAVIVGLLVGCSSGGDESAADTSSGDTTSVAADDQGSEAAPEKADSIPMSVTITIPTVRESSGTFNGGTFRSEGKGARCEHFPNAAAGQHEWSVLYPGDSGAAPNVGPLQFSVGKLENGRTTQLSLMVMAGTVEAAGMKGPLNHVISTPAPGAPSGSAATAGSGTVTVTRDGPRVRFELDGISGLTKRSFKMTLVCEREGKWV